MKTKFKTLQPNQVVFVMHSESKDYSEYHAKLVQYATLVKKLDKSEKAKLKNTVPSQQGKKFTLSAVLDSLTGDCFVGLALCSEKDNFSKKNGRLIATDKAIVYKNKQGKVVSGNPIAYFNIKDKADLTDVYSCKKVIYEKLKSFNEKIKENPDNYKSRNIKNLIEL